MEPPRASLSVPVAEPPGAIVLELSCQYVVDPLVCQEGMPPETVRTSPGLPTPSLLRVVVFEA